MKEVTVIENRSVMALDYKLEDFLERFIISLDIKDKSKDTYRKALRQFFKFMFTNNLSNLTREDILKYKAYLTENYSSYTVSAYLVAVKKFFEWLESIKSFPNIAKGIKGAKAHKGFKKDSLTVEQVKRVLRSMDRLSIEGKRNYALLNLLVRTGLRTIETVRANVEDIRQESGEALLYVQGKGRDDKDTFVLLTEDTLQPIRDYLTARKVKSPKEPLFASISDRNNGGRLTTRTVSRIAKEHLREIGLDDSRLTAHSFRHTAVTLSLLGGATIQEAQALARHANINTTLIYAHNIDRINKAPERKIDALLADV